SAWRRGVPRVSPKPCIITGRCEIKMLKHNRGYTLVEMLVATVLTLMMMSAVVGLFDSVGRGISNSRALLDTNDRLRMAARQLQRDLGGVTVTMSPPR